VASWCIRLVKRIDHAHAIVGLLGNSIDHRGCGERRSLENRWCNVDNMRELRPDAAFVLYARGPRDDHAVGYPAQMRGDLLGPFKRCIAGPSPSHRIIIERFGASQFINFTQSLLKTIRYSIQKLVFVDCAFKPTLGARTIITGYVNYYCIV